jgi:hypothetical protein
MSGITDWSEALADPCFWAAHYALHLWGAARDVEAFFGRSVEHCEAFLLNLYGDDDFETPLPSDAEYEYTPASVLGLSFPENYTWMLKFGGYELGHEIYHPQIYPEGLLMAGEIACACPDKRRNSPVKGAGRRLPSSAWVDRRKPVRRPHFHAETSNSDPSE